MAPTRLVLAGGLGASPYLRRWLAAAFGSSLGQLTVLPAAVVHGAVRLLQKPGSIAARVSNETYCIQVRWGPLLLLPLQGARSYGPEWPGKPMACSPARVSAPSCHKPCDPLPVQHIC